LVIHHFSQQPFYVAGGTTQDPGQFVQTDIKRLMTTVLLILKPEQQIIFDDIHAITLVPIGLFEIILTERPGLGHLSSRANPWMNRRI
jgi:hypothetical protein